MIITSRKLFLWFYIFFFTASLKPLCSAYGSPLEEELQKNTQIFETYTFLYENLLSAYSPSYLTTQHTLHQYAEEIIKKKIKPLSEPLKKWKFKDKENRFIIKKRHENNLRECVVWDLANLFSVSEYITPSYPLTINNTQVVVQLFSSFKRFHSESRVSLEEYWKALFIAYIFGLGDLCKGNIGVLPSGKILFFDNELSLPLKNQSPKTRNGEHDSFVFHSKVFIFSQYSKPLTKTEIEAIQRLLQPWKSVGKAVDEYHRFMTKHFKNPSFSKEAKDALCERLEKVLQYPLKEGTTFQQFIQYLYS